MSSLEDTRRDDGHAGGWYERTSEVQLTPEVGMALTLVLPDADCGQPQLTAPAFLCSASSSGSEAAFVRAAGDLDLAAVPLLAGTLREVQVQARVVVLDLRELNLIVMTAVRAIATAGGRARQAGRRLVVLRGTRSVHRIFELTDGSDAIEIRELDPCQPPVQVLLQLAAAEPASRTSPASIWAGVAQPLQPRPAGVAKREQRVPRAAVAE